MSLGFPNHQTTSIRPRPATTSTVPEVSSVVGARAFHEPDVCERAGTSWVFLCTRERIQPRGPRSSSLRNPIEEMAGVERGKVVVGSIPTVAPYFLPGCLASISRKFPDIQVSVVEELTSELLEECRMELLI